VVICLAKVVGKCRFSDKIVLPCNFVSGGFCGNDGLACKVVVAESA